MRAVVQRVDSASVTVEGAVAGSIGRGLLVLLGVEDGDGEPEARWLAGKLCRLRIFSRDGRFQDSVQDVDGAMLVVSQFTLLGDARKGNRPDFLRAARPELAEPLYERFCEFVEAHGVPVQRGVFGASMQVDLRNDGPVTLIVERAPGD